jgi:hypothetical protein
MTLPYNVSTLPSYPWTSPGSNPYRGSFEDALSRYAGEIPPTPLRTLRELVQRPASTGRYVVIDKRGIRSPDGVYSYGHLRMMHFGDGQVLRGVMDTSMWADDFTVGALVFSAAQYCICIPTICRNVSIVTQLTPALREVYVQPPAGARALPEPGSLALVTLAGAAAWLVRRRVKLQR